MPVTTTSHGHRPAIALAAAALLCVGALAAFLEFPLPSPEERREPGRTVGEPPAAAPSRPHTPPATQEVHPPLTRLATLPAHREARAPLPPTPPLPDQRWIVPFAWGQTDAGALVPPASLRGCAALRVVGHTCSLGRPDANHAIGLARASAVRDALVAAGIPADAITLASAGESAPVATNATPDGRAANRRVETTCSPETP